MRAPEPIAIIGVACRLPGVATPEDFWSLMQRGGSAIGPVPASRWQWSDDDGFPPQPAPQLFRQGGFIDDLERFDAAFFKLSAAEAARLDPQQKLALEVSWQALESACITPAELAGSTTGVIMGVAHGEHALKLKSDHASYDGHLGPSGYDGFVAHRVSHVLNLKGPSYSVNAACASSSHAIHLACQSLRTDECDLVLAGGVNVHLAVDETVSCALAGWLAKDGRCKSFSDGGDGYVRGEGCGVVVLKRLADARRDGDPVWGVLSGSALGHNGLSGGIAWPSGNGQRELLRRALARTGLQPAQVDYLEAHGTGAALSDRIEASAFTDVLAPGRDAGQLLHVGCCKPHVGHLEAASGVAALIKVLLCLRAGELPALPNLAPVNRAIRPHASVNLLAAPAAWPRREGHVRRALVSNFSFGGANAVLVVEEAPADLRPARAEADALAGDVIPAALPGPRLLALRARSEAGLVQLRASLCRHLQATGQALGDDQAFSLNRCRTEFRHRLTYLGADAAALAGAFLQDDLAARVATADLAPVPAGARLVLVLGPAMLGHDWHDPEAELRRWFVTARVLDQLRQQGDAFAPGGTSSGTMADFWIAFFRRLGLPCDEVVAAPGLGVAARGLGLAQRPWPASGDLRTLREEGGTARVFFGPDTAPTTAPAIVPTTLPASIPTPGDPIAPSAPSAPPAHDAPTAAADWRPGLARLLLRLYCLGFPLDWTLLSTGRKTSLSGTPFDRQPSWFQPTTGARPRATQATDPADGTRPAPTSSTHPPACPPAHRPAHASMQPPTQAASTQAA